MNTFSSSMSSNNSMLLGEEIGTAKDLKLLWEMALRGFTLI